MCTALQTQAVTAALFRLDCGELNFVVGRARKEKKREKREKKGEKRREKNMKRKKGERKGPWGRAEVGSRSGRRAQWDSLRCVTHSCMRMRMCTGMALSSSVNQN